MILAYVKITMPKVIIKISNSDSIKDFRRKLKFKNIKSYWKCLLKTGRLGQSVPLVDEALLKIPDIVYFSQIRSVLREISLIF